MLWAWERPEELRFIDPSRMGVAFLAETVFLEADSVMVRPRLQPLRVPGGTALVAVVRVESSRLRPARLSADQREQTVAAIGRLTELAGIRGVQVDFDATTSERAFYRLLLIDLRRELPRSLGLSVTALASWCIGDLWLDTLPPGTIDNAVPMLFRMGTEHASVMRYLASGRPFRSPVCRTSVGVSTDEPMPTRGAGSTLYIFHPRAWSPSALDSFLRGVRP